MKTKLLNQEGAEVGTVDLNEQVFGVKVNEGLIHRALIYQLSNARRVVAHSKTRGERRGSTRKIYRQKGTGRARMGSNRSPIRKKGGVVFGPRNGVNFTISMNKKERRYATFSVLSQKVNDGKLLVLDDIKFEENKTKNMVTVLSKIPYEKNVLIAVDGKNESVERTSSNLPYVKTLDVNYLNIKDLLKYNTLMLLKSSLDKLNALK